MSPEFAAFYFAVLYPKLLSLTGMSNGVEMAKVVDEVNAMAAQWFKDHPTDSTPHN